MANEQYAKTLGAQIASMQRQLAQMSAGERTATMGYSSIEDSYIRAYDAQGQAMMLLGKQTDGNYAVTYQDGAPPPKTSGPLVTAHQLSLSIGWNGEFAPIDKTPTPRPTNVVRVDVHVSKTPGFTPDGTTAIGSLAGEGVVSVFADSEPHFVRLVAVTNADVIGPPSEEVGVIPLAASQIAVGAIGADQIAANVILSSRIIVGDPTLGRVELQGGATVDSGLTAFNANGQKIVQIRPTGSPFIVNNADGKMVFSINNNGFIGTVNPVTGQYVWLFNTDGSLQVNNTDGTKTFTIDSSGNVTTKGTIRTADSGSRIEIKPGVGITFFPSVGAATATNWTNWQQNEFSDTFDGNAKKSGFRILAPQTKPFSGALYHFGDMMMGGAATEYWSVRVREAASGNEWGRIIVRARNVEVVSGPMPSQGHYQLGNWASKLFLPWGGGATNGTSAQPITLLSQINYENDNTYATSGLQMSVDPQFAAVMYQNRGLQMRNWDNNAFTEIAASQFIVSSYMESKTDIKPLEDSALEILRQAPSSQWDYKTDDDPTSHRAGPMADDLPDWMCRTPAPVQEPAATNGATTESAPPPQAFAVAENSTVDLATQIGVLWAALREMDEEMDAMRKAAKVAVPKRNHVHKRSRFYSAPKPLPKAPVVTETLPEAAEVNPPKRRPKR